MALFFWAMAILAIIGAGAVVYWARRTQEGVTCGVVAMAVVLLVAGVGMAIWGLYWR